MKVIYIDRKTQTPKVEKIYGGKWLHFLYQHRLRWIGFPLLYLIATCALCSRFYGFLQRRSYTKKKIEPFIKDFDVNTVDFEKPISHFSSFNDFFCRKLKPEARPIAAGNDIAIIPADGRFLVYPDISLCDGIFVKGKAFSLKNLLSDLDLYQEYKEGGLMIGRLAPVDYHRFHFPTEGVPNQTKFIDGKLFSVNPLALMKNISIFTQNKRALTLLEQTPFGKIILMEIGATHVGSIHQTYKPDQPVQKGEEKGFFSFGGSALIYIFPKNSIEFCQDLLNNSKNHLETLCQMGQPLGKKK